DKESETIIIKRMDFPSTRDPWFEQFARVELMEEIMSFWEDEVLTIRNQDEEVEDGNPWYFDIENFYRDRSFPEYATHDDKTALARIAQRYKIIGEVLHRKAFSGLYIRCITEEESLQIMEEAHAGECGGHFNGQTLAKRVLKWYYWPTLEKDCADFAKRCTKCQLHANKIHAPSSSLHPISAPWPFAMWAFDVVGPIEDSSGEIKRKSFILTATEYFTKWVEAEAFAEIKASTVVKFIRSNIIARFGIPRDIVTDNGPQFVAQELQ